MQFSPNYLITMTAHIAGCRKFQIDALVIISVLVPLTRVPRRLTTEWLINLLTSSSQRQRLKRNRWLKPGVIIHPNNLDKSLNDVTVDKIRKYHADYNNIPPSVVSFMPAIASTSGRLHSEFIRLLFLQTHRETDRFFETSGVQFVQHNRCDILCSA
jgi:hypothetical protein